MKQTTAILRCLATLMPVLLLADSEPPHPEGLLLRGFESAGAANRRGISAVSSGVATTVRIDAAGEVSANQSAADLAPLISWYQDRGQFYSAYATFSPGIGDAIGYLESEVSSAGRTINLDGEEDGICLFLPEAYAAIATVAKAYVDAGVDSIHYDTSWVHGGAGPFDATSLSLFRDWLNTHYSLAELQGLIDSGYDATTFDYRSFLVAGGITADNYSGASIDGTVLFHTKHWRLWQAFLRAQERAVVATLVDEVNTYAMGTLGREIGFYFNRYGFIDRPADRWYLAEFASGDLGETHFSGQTWDFHRGYSLEPVYRATLKTYDNRFEPWNSPPQGYTAAKSVFLAETIANNGVATWEDDYAATAPIARLARRYEAQLDHAPVSDLAVFYPLATANHNLPMQIGTQPLIGGSHYWYLGLGYILQDLNLNYDVVFGGDGLGMPDAFSSADLAGHDTLVVAEAIQVTDNQFTVLMDWVDAGGTLLVMGANVFRYDALGEDQSAGRSSGANSWSDLFGSVGTRAIGSGSVQVLSLDPWGSHGYTDQPSSSRLSTIASTLSAALPAGTAAVSTAATGDVRILRFMDESDSSEVYHILNYTFNSVGSAVTAQTGFTVTIPAPDGFSGPPVASYANSAESDPVSLALSDNGDGTFTVTIPSLVYWGILRLGSAIADTPHPNIPPIAEMGSFFSYEVFRNETTRDITYSAVDDSEIFSIQVYYQEKNPSTGEWGSWTAGQLASGFGTNALIEQTLAFNLPGEGHFRLQLVATDDEGAGNALIVGGYDTELGYDTTSAERGGLNVVVEAGPENGSTITTPVGPSLSVDGVTDPISGIFQVIYDWGTGSGSLEAGGVPFDEDTGRTFSLPAPTEGAYNTYSFSLRFQNNAQIWDEAEIVYSYVYTAPPTYNGTAVDRSASNNDYVEFSLEYSNPYGDVTIAWYKDDALIEGETGNNLPLFSVTAADNGTYHAIITNPAGSVASTDFDLTVITPIEIISQPAGANIEEGDAFTVTVEARGTGTLGYQWRLEGVDIDGATAASYSISNAVRAEHNGHYRCLVTDETGASVESNGAFVQVQGGGGGDGSGSFNVSVNRPEAAPLTIGVLGTDLLSNLRTRIAATAGLGSTPFFLFLGSTELAGDNQLSTYGIVANSILTLNFDGSNGGDGAFHISINQAGQPPFSLEVADTDSVSDLSGLVATETGLKREDFDLLFSSLNLTNTPEATLGSFGIGPDVVINLVLKMGGGGKFQLTIEFPSIPPLMLEREPLSTLAELGAAIIAKRPGLAEVDFQLMFMDQALTDGAASLEALGLGEGDTIQLKVPKRGLNYADFAADAFGSATLKTGPWDDFDSDGTDNFLEYVFGRDILQEEDAGKGDALLKLHFESGSAHLAWTQRREISDAEIKVTISHDFGQTWVDASESDFVEDLHPTAEEAVDAVRWTYQGALTGTLLFQGHVSEPAP